MVSLSDSGCLNYLRNLTSNEKEYFLLPWGGVVLKDCSGNGDLLSFKGVKNYKERHILGENQWIFLTIQLFMDQVSVL